jgi:HPt (histidine-containing phosphotransfer) domain-containing protein
MQSVGYLHGKAEATSQVRFGAERDPKPVLAISEADADLELLVELVGITQAACPVLLQNLQAAVTKGDLRGVVKGAHLIRAAAKSVSAERTCDVADRLEIMARQGLPEGIPEAFLNLQRELERLGPALAAFADSLPTAQRSLFH